MLLLHVVRTAANVSFRPDADISALASTSGVSLVHVGNDAHIKLIFSSWLALPNDSAKSRNTAAISLRRAAPTLPQMTCRVWPETLIVRRMTRGDSSSQSALVGVERTLL